MRLDEQMTINAKPEAVWALFQDPQRVTGCIPGAQFDERLDDGSYRGSLQVRFGPKVVRFGGTAVYTTDEEARTGELTATGSDRRGSSRAEMTLTFVLEPIGDTTSVRVAADARFAGPLSQFAETGGVRIAQVLLHDFGRQVAEVLTPTGAQASAHTQSAPATPLALASPAVKAAPAPSPRPALSPPPASAFRLVLAVLRAQLASLRRRIVGPRRDG